MAYDEAKAKLIAFDAARNQELKRLQEENAALHAQLSAQVKETADSLHDDAVKLKEAAVRPADADAVDARITRLTAAIEATLRENAHLADGEDCTLIHLKRAIAAQSTEGAKG